MSPNIGSVLPALERTGIFRHLQNSSLRSPSPSSVMHSRSPTSDPTHSTHSPSNSSTYPSLSEEVRQAAMTLIKELESIAQLKIALAISENHVLRLSQELKIERGKVIMARHECQRPGYPEATIAEMLKMNSSEKDERLKILAQENRKLSSDNERLVAQLK